MDRSRRNPFIYRLNSFPSLHESAFGPNVIFLSSQRLFRFRSNSISLQCRRWLQLKLKTRTQHIGNWFDFCRSENGSLVISPAATAVLRSKGKIFEIDSNLIWNFYGVCRTLNAEFEFVQRSLRAFIKLRWMKLFNITIDCLTIVAIHRVNQKLFFKCQRLCRPDIAS